jgi:hypothetical protein
LSRYQAKAADSSRSGNAGFFLLLPKFIYAA